MWSKENVHSQFYDAETKVLSFYLSSFCTFALTTRKYCNFPLKSWKLMSNERNSVVLTLAAKLMTIEIEVTIKGYIMNLLEPRKTFFKPISQPLELDDFIAYAKKLNLNVFTDDDASFYVEDAPLKLPSLEQHTYQCMSCFCSTYEFHSSVWNKFSNYRTICVETRPAVPTAMGQEIMVTTDRAEFVEIEKRATEFESDDVKLEFRRKPEIQEVTEQYKCFKKHETFM
jgi:Cancer susceptibility candidate 1 C-terminal